jgi:anti-sigma regulatory factor (Ser/Thr protein kinase)
MLKVDLELIDLAVLLANEIVTNAVLHARTSFTLAAVVSQNEVLRVIVKDDNPRLPQVALAPTDAASGRGLMMVQALADHWGIDSDETGKRVWFELRVA